MGSLPESEVDLLIVGAGPAGLMAAAWASRFNVSTRIIDKEPTRVQAGHADGIQPRTLEILDGFGLADQIMRQSCPDIEIVSWGPDDEGHIQRTQRIRSQMKTLSIFPQTGLQQGAIEQIFEDYFRETDKLKVERNLMPVDIRFDLARERNPKNHPITVILGCTNTPNGREDHRDVELEGDPCEIVSARYLVGCDGAHSWVRRQLGIDREGSSTSEIWGVMDIIPITNFPDIRQSCVIDSPSSRSMMTVPRENRLVRLYIELSPETPTGRTPGSVIEEAQEILKPYEIKYEHCDWFSIYKIQQHVTPQLSYHNRIFLAGDAVHTHSPKLGQGMNVSIQDAFNLGWKLGSVIEGWARPTILQTYGSERREVAERLVAVDKEITQFYSHAGENESSKDGNRTERDMQKFRDQHYRFLSGTEVTYGGSVLVADEAAKTGVRGSRSPRELAANIQPGRRLPLFNVTNHAGAYPVHSLRLLYNSGRWRLIVFAGDLGKQALLEQYQILGHQLADPEPPLAIGNPPRNAIGRAIDLLTVHCGPRRTINILDLHNIYHPFDDRLGWDYWKIYVDDPDLQDGLSVYDQLGITRSHGCSVVVRPDQHVGFIGPLDDIAAVRNYFAQILV